MEESGRVSGKGRIRATTYKLYRRLPKYGRISVSTAKWKISGEYWEKVESVRGRKNCPDEYQKMEESGQVPRKGRI